MSIDQDIANSARQLEADVKINHAITHGDENTDVATEGGPVPSIRKRLKDIETEWSQTADPLADSLADVLNLAVDYKDAAISSAESATASEASATDSKTRAAQWAQTAGTAAETSAIAQAATAANTAEVANNTQLTRQYRDEAEQSISALDSALDTIGGQILALSTSLIRTQTIITSHHAWQ